MKKKIINGILMVAMLFATSTSFVSCKDSLSDEVANGFDKVASDMKALQNDLQGKIDGLNSQINDMNAKIAQLESDNASNKEEIAKLKGQVADLQSLVSALESDLTALKGDVANNAAAIAELEARTTDLESKVSDVENRVTVVESEINKLWAAFKNLIVGVTVRTTVDPVVGSINLPGYNPLFLAAFYGENVWKETYNFPVAGDDYNVLSDGLALSKNDIAGEKVEIGKRIGATTNNAGTLYFTLNPIGANTEGVTYDLVNSVGEVSPVILSDAKPVSYINTPALGNINSSAAEEASNAYLFAADATIPVDVTAELAWNKNIKLAQLKNDLSAIFANLQAANKGNVGSTAKTVASQSYDLMLNFMGGWCKNMTAMEYQNLRVTYTDPETNDTRIVTSPENILTATVSPLSYNTFKTIGEALPKGVDLEVVENLLGKLVKAVQSRLPEMGDIKIEFTPGDVTLPDNLGDNIYFVVTDKNQKYVYADGKFYDEDGNEISETGFGSYSIEDLLKEIIAQIQNGLDTETINNQIADILAKYNNIKYGDYSSVIERAVSYVENQANRILAALGGNIAFKAVTPIILIDTTDGLRRLQSGATLTNAEATLVLTSLTQEVLVPAYKKYVAVVQNGKVQDAQLLDGNAKVADVKIPAGNSEIVYSVVDYSGYTVTKRYAVSR